MSFRIGRFLIPAIAFAAGSAFVGGTVFFGRPAFAQTQKSGKVDDATLRNAAQGKGEEWLSYGFTPQETRYSPLNQINASNVARLGLAWSVEVGPGGAGRRRRRWFTTE